MKRRSTRSGANGRDTCKGGSRLERAREAACQHPSREALRFDRLALWTRWQLSDARTCESGCLPRRGVRVLPVVAQNRRPRVQEQPSRGQRRAHTAGPWPRTPFPRSRAQPGPGVLPGRQAWQSCSSGQPTARRSWPIMRIASGKASDRSDMPAARAIVRFATARLRRSMTGSNTCVTIGRNVDQVSQDETLTTSGEASRFRSRVMTGTAAQDLIHIRGSNRLAPAAYVWPRPPRHVDGGAA